ncbi:site-2 protease family protein [Parasphingorhabdus pacifica]
MNESVRLGRIAGVRVGVHWSLLGIVLLISVGLAVYQLPTVLPGHSHIGYVLSGLTAAGLLVVSLLGHELAHAIVARRNGVAVDGITLWLLGGVARLRGEARTPAAEFRIAVVGPAASFVIAIAFGGLAVGAGALNMNQLVVVVLGYLALLNTVLAVFNLLPAAPLDGGRVLRAVLWSWNGDRYRAAVWSSRAGRGLGFVLIAGGVLLLFNQNNEGLWWILLGLFVVSVASAEERQARVGAKLTGIRVRDVMSGPVSTVDGRLSVEHFLRFEALDRNHSSFPLLNPAGEFSGLVTLGQLRAVPQQVRDRTALIDVACPATDVPTADPDDQLAEVLPRLSGAAGGRLVVHGPERVVGVVSPSDISRVVAARGLNITIPGGADLVWQEDEPPPPDWTYPGQGRPR